MTVIIFDTRTALHSHASGSLIAFYLLVRPPVFQPVFLWISRLLLVLLFLFPFLAFSHSEDLPEEPPPPDLHWSKEYDVLVIGAGIAGHTAALAASEQGNRVLLIEERAMSEPDFTSSNWLNKTPWAKRNRNVSIDLAAIEQLESLIQTELPITPIDRATIFDRFGKVTLNEEYYNRLSSFFLKGRTAGGFIKIGDLERLLYSATLRLRDEHYWNTSYNQKREPPWWIVPPKTKKRTPRIPVKDYSSGSVTLWVNTRVESIGRDYVYLNTEYGNNPGRKILPIKVKTKIIADGGGSDTLKQLGIQRTQVDGVPSSQWLVANFKTAPNTWGESKIDIRKTPDHPYHRLAFVGDGITTVYASPYSGKFDSRDYEAIIKKTAQMLDVKGLYQNDVDFFESHVNHSSTFVDPKKRIIVVGDALFKHDPMTGFGVTSAVLVSKIIGDFFDWRKKIHGHNLTDESYLALESKLKEVVAMATQQSQRAQLNKLVTRVPLYQLPVSATLRVMQHRQGPIEALDFNICKNFYAPPPIQYRSRPIWTRE